MNVETVVMTSAEKLPIRV